MKVTPRSALTVMVFCAGTTLLPGSQRGFARISTPHVSTATINTLLVRAGDLRKGYVRTNSGFTFNASGRFVDYKLPNTCREVYNEVRPATQYQSVQDLFLTMIITAVQKVGINPYNVVRTVRVGDQGVNVSFGDGGGPCGPDALLFRRKNYVDFLVVYDAAAMPLARVLDQRIQHSG
jgi:hypothetical protein